MGDISKHFSRWEFRCKCKDCQDTFIDPNINMALITLLELIIIHFEEKKNARVSILINSGNRCKIHNGNIGGASKSKHITGEGADIVVRYLDDDEQWIHVETKEIYELINDLFPKCFGVKTYVNPKRTHADVREDRWRG